MIVRVRVQEDDPDSAFGRCMRSCAEFMVEMGDQLKYSRAATFVLRLIIGLLIILALIMVSTAGKGAGPSAGQVIRNIIHWIVSIF